MNQKITNVATVIIATCALGLSIWQGVAQRQHNELSTEPRVNAYFKVDGEKWGLFVFNNGLGPAYIEDVKITVTSADGSTVVWAGKDFMQATAHMGLSAKCLAIGGPRKNDSLQLQEEIGLIYLPREVPPSCAVNTLLLKGAIESRLDFTLVVKSIYGKRFSYNFKNNEQLML